MTSLIKPGTRLPGVYTLKRLYFELNGSGYMIYLVFLTLKLDMIETNPETHLPGVHTLKHFS
jgi:hypothetical protein